MCPKFYCNLMDAVLDKVTVASDVSLLGIRILFNASLRLRYLGLTSFKAMKINIKMVLYVRSCNCGS